ncbi:MAG: Aspartate aminotransferase, partial [uncultured Gemmatimonadetes bacterium]
EPCAHGPGPDAPARRAPPAARRRAAAGPHPRVRARRDHAGRPAGRCARPRARHPRASRPRRRARGGGRGHPPRQQPVRQHLGGAGAARGRRRQGARLPGRGGGSGDGGHGDLRVHRGVPFRAFQRGGRRRRGAALRAAVRAPPLGRALPGRGSAHRDPARAGVELRPGGAGQRLRPAHPRGGGEHPREPHRQGVHPRRAGAHRRPLRAVGRGVRERRDLRAHGVRRPRAPVAAGRRDAPGAHAFGERDLQDLSRVGVADRLRDRRPAAHARAPQGARPGHGGGGGAAAGGGGARARRGAALLSGARARPPGAPPPAGGAAGAARLHLPPRAGKLLHDGRGRRVRLSRRRGLRAPPDPHLPRGHGAGRRFLCRAGRRPADGAGVLRQDGRDAGGGRGAPARARAGNRRSARRRL